MQTTSTLSETTHKKNEWIFWIILIIPFIYIPFIWHKLPESIPTHWNIHGEPDNYSSKIYGTFHHPILNIIVYFVMLVIPKIDPRKRNYSVFSNSYRNIRIAISLFFLLLFFISVLGAMGSAKMDSKMIFILVMKTLLNLKGDY